MSIAYVSDESYAALADVRLEFTSGAKVWLASSSPSGAVHADIPAGEYVVCLGKPGYGSKRVKAAVDPSRPVQFRLLSDRLLGYAWPKWCRGGEVVQFRVH